MSALDDMVMGFRVVERDICPSQIETEETSGTQRGRGRRRLGASRQTWATSWVGRRPKSFMGTHISCQVSLHSLWDSLQAGESFWDRLRVLGLAA